MTLLGTLVGKAVPTLLCSFARSQCAGKELSAAARKLIGRATGFAN